MAELMQGKPVADAIYSALETRIQALRARRIHPRLAILRVGEDPANASYERTILARAADVGIRVEVRELAADVNRLALFADIEGINVDASMHGCLIFRPLPDGLDELKACNMIASEKDVDGVGARSLAGVFMDMPEGFAPCTAQGCVQMLDFYGVDLVGKHVAVIGRSLVVGKPAAMLLLKRDATVTLCHSNTADLAAITQAADIIVCATGNPRTFGASYVRPGQIVLDVGANVDADGMLCGDVDFDAVEPIVEWITPVPGGLGAVTTALLLEHVVEAAERMH